jgi:hypothetical protein
MLAVDWIERCATMFYEVFFSMYLIKNHLLWQHLFLRTIAEKENQDLPNLKSAVSELIGHPWWI